MAPASGRVRPRLDFARRTARPAARPRQEAQGRVLVRSSRRGEDGTQERRAQRVQSTSSRLSQRTSNRVLESEPVDCSTRATARELRRGPGTSRTRTAQGGTRSRCLATFEQIPVATRWTRAWTPSWLSRPGKPGTRSAGRGGRGWSCQLRSAAMHARASPPQPSQKKPQAHSAPCDAVQASQGTGEMRAGDEGEEKRVELAAVCERAWALVLVHSSACRCARRL